MKAGLHIILKCKPLQSMIPVFAVIGNCKSAIFGKVKSAVFGKVKSAGDLQEGIV